MGRPVHERADRPLRVCIFTETYHPVTGGGETQARLLADGLAAAGHPVILLTRRSDRAFPERETVGAAEVFRLPPSGGGQLKKWGLVFSGLPALVSLRNRYDLIFVSGFRMIGIPAIIAGKLLGKTVILKADSQGEMSGSYFAGGLKKAKLSPRSLPFRLFLGLRNLLFRRADAFSAIWEGTAAEYISHGVPPGKVYTIPNCADTTRFFPVTPDEKSRLRARLGIPEHAVAAVYTGRLVSYKGLPLLLKVWQEISARHEHARLLLAGSGGLDMYNCEDELRAFVKENGLEDKVTFTGSVQNVQEYLQASDLFVFPTQEDAFPSSVIEAMACALPVVTTPVGAITTFVKNESNGLLVQPGNGPQLSQAIDRLICDTSLASRLGREGLRAVQESYSARAVTRQYLDLFNTAARRRQE